MCPCTKPHKQYFLCAAADTRLLEIATGRKSTGRKQMIEEMKRLIKGLQTAFQLEQIKSEEIFEFSVFSGWRKLSEQKEGVHTPSGSREKKYYPVLRGKPSFWTRSGARSRQTQAGGPRLLPSPPGVLPSRSRCPDSLCQAAVLSMQCLASVSLPNPDSRRVMGGAPWTESVHVLFSAHGSITTTLLNYWCYRPVCWDLQAGLPRRTLKPGNAPWAQRWVICG